MQTQKEKLMVIDGNALIHRSFHALPLTIQTKDGFVTNAIFGFIATLIKAIKDLNPTYIALTLDRPEPTFRHKEYKEYKAHREAQPDELYAQIPKIKKIAKALNIPIYSKAGFEADDLIGTICRKIDGKIEKIILTGDMDTLQLVNNDTKVYAMSRGVQDAILYNHDKVKEKYSGLSPNQMTDYKALRGDPSDNIPGVKGIGEKTATELLTNFNTLDKIYSQIKSDKVSNVKPRIIELLKKYKKDAYLSKKLATIKCNTDIDFKLKEAKFGNFNKEELSNILKDLEFNSLILKINSLHKQNKQTEEINKFERNQKIFQYKLIQKDKEFDEFLKIIKKQKKFTFDTEADAKNALTANLLGISFSWEKDLAYYLIIDLSNKTNDSNNNLFNYQNKKEEKNTHPWLTKLKPIFEDKTIKKSGHNIKYDINILSNYNIDVKGIYFDTRLASYILNPSTRQHDLDSLALIYLEHEKINKTDLLGAGKNKITYAEAQADKIGIYSCEDADCTEKLIKPLEKKLKENKLYKLYSRIEIPLIKILSKMEQAGIEIDSRHLSSLDSKLTDRLKAITKKIYKLSKEPFNINSPKQLKVILFERLGLSTHQIGKTKTGLSTAASELEKLRDSHPIIPLIEEHRELSKLLSTYTKALPTLISPKTNRIHTNLNQTITATGRLSSQNPNLQNIPTRTELGQLIRKAFIAKSGFELLSLDYSQIELRLAAHLSEDEKMIKAFKDGADIHTMTAAQINNINISKVTKNMRREAKAINFGILYGQGPRGLSQTTGMTHIKAQEFIDNYFKVFKNIKRVC